MKNSFCALLSIFTALPSKSSLAPSTDSWQHIEQAKGWLDRCKALHDCGDFTVVTNNPKRIVEVTSSTKGLHLRLKKIDASKKMPEYLAFSHCWGGSNSSLRLLKCNRVSFQENISFSKLSRNMRDAVQITNWLGFSYIWVDSLCIIQDSPEDWSKESLKMGSVYAGAVCTIASTGSASGDGGYFHERRPLGLQPCKIGIRSIDDECSGGIYIRQDDLLDFQLGVENAPLNQRGWVFQERLLSRRILHFGAEGLYWECPRRCASELSPNGYVYRKFPEDFGDQNSQFIKAKMSQEVARTRPRDRSSPIRDPYGLYKPQAAWQKSRNAWKDIRRASDQGWEHDAGNGDGCGLRAHFNLLRQKRYADQRLMGGFTHCWYEIVEPYTRGKLTFSKDKLVALSAIAQEIQLSTGYTYLAGIWKEHLLTDLLWFVLEKPGRRLNKTGDNIASSAKNTAPTISDVAPTWS